MNIAVATGACFLALGATLAIAAPAEDGLSACLAKCNRSKLSETNRETCRLDCEVDASTDPDAINADVKRRLAPKEPGATGTTPGSAKPTGGTTAGSAKPAGSTTTPVGGTAPVAPAGGRAGCKAQCDADRTLSADDRATCKLECDLVDDPTPPATGTATGTDPKGMPATGTLTVPGLVAKPTGSDTSTLGASSAGFLSMCMQSCRSGPVKLSETDQATCQLTCENAATVVDFAVDAAPTMWMGIAPTPTLFAQPKQPTTATPPATGAPPASATPAATVGVKAKQPATPAPASTCDAARGVCSDACGKVQKRCEQGCKGKGLSATDRETCKLECGEADGLCRADCVADHATCVNRR
jgi:hypothetical protein